MKSTSDGDLPYGIIHMIIPCSDHSTTTNPPSCSYTCFSRLSSYRSPATVSDPTAAPAPCATPALSAASDPDAGRLALPDLFLTYSPPKLWHFPTDSDTSSLPGPSTTTDGSSNVPLEVITTKRGKSMIIYEKNLFQERAQG